MNPNFPLYIPSKGRFDSMLTSKALDRMGVPHRIVIEESEYLKYLEAVSGDKAKLLILDMAYKEKYELCDEFGLSKSTGSGPARNFIWEHSISEGWDWHWIMDDNIRCFYRNHQNNRIEVLSGAIFRAMEDFVLRYKNIGMAGPCYSMFAIIPKMEQMTPFIMNTRIYSCNFIRNDLPFRWRGRFNEDTILSLDMLKAGLCTVQFYAFLQNKMATQTMSGGNTDEIYQEGTMEKSRMLVREHPDVAKVTWEYGRWHHHVDYAPFRRQKLILKDGVIKPRGSNQYGMRLSSPQQ